MVRGDVCCTTLGLSRQLPPRDPALCIDAATGPILVAHDTGGTVFIASHNGSTPIVSPLCLVPCTNGNASTTVGTSTLAHAPGSSVALAPVASQVARPRTRL
jgi:hypothetical protein